MQNVNEVVRKKKAIGRNETRFDVCTFGRKILVKFLVDDGNYSL